MEKHRDEHVIYIKDLIFSILYGWRKLLVWGLLLALLLGGYRGITAWNSMTLEASQAAAETTSAYTSQRELLQLEISRLKERIEVFGAYIAQTPYMQLNPHSIYVGNITVYVEPAEGSTYVAGDQKQPQLLDPSDSLLQVYRALLSQEENMNTVAKALNLEGKSMEGLIDVNYDLTTNILTVIVRQAAREDAEMVLDIMEESIAAAQTEVEKTVGSHSLSIFGRSVTLRNDADLATLQDETAAKLLKVKESLTAKETELENLVPPVVPTVSKKAVVITALKYAVLGGVLGIFVAAVFLCLGHLARGKVYSCRTLEDYTGLYILGAIPGSRRHCFIDTLLYKWDLRCTANVEDQSALIAARVRNLCAADARLLVAGAADSDSRLPVLEALEKAGVSVVANGNLLTSIDAVSALPSCDGVILIEQCNKSRYEAVRKTAEQLEAMGKPLLGCVLVNG